MPARRAFTMIELMIVIMVIALLIGLLIPGIGMVRRKAKEAKAPALLYSEQGLVVRAARDFGGGKVPARTPGDGLQVIEDAPGSYVASRVL